MKLRRSDVAPMIAIAVGALAALAISGRLLSHEGHAEHVSIYHVHDGMDGHEHVVHADETSSILHGHTHGAESAEHVREVRVEARGMTVETREAEGGVVVTETSGGTKVRIRGEAVTAPHGRVVSASQEPIIYVDGIRLEGDRESVLSDLDPEKIDRVEVIKGDAAVEVFGAEAAKGVVQIFTKAGMAPGGR